MENIILPVLFAGFGNKLGSLFSGLVLSRRLNKKLLILNVNSNVGNLDLNSIFEFNYPIKNFTSFKEIDDIIDLSFPIFTTKSFDFRRKCIPYESFDIRKSPDSFLYLCHKAMDMSPNNLNIFLNTFKIKSDVKSKINEFANAHGLNKNVYGLHIRASDFPERNNNIERARKFIELNQNKKILICTDEKQVEEDLSIYKNVIFRQKNSYTEKLNPNINWNVKYFDQKYNSTNYNSLRDNQCSVDAFIDMILLSKTNLSGNVNNGSTFYKWCEHFSNVNIN